MDYYNAFLESQEASRQNRCTVQLSPAKSNWIALPSHMAMQLLQYNTPTPTIFRLAPHGAPGAPPPGPPVHVAWVGDICTTPGMVIEVPTALAACLNLLPGMSVVITHVQHVPLASTVVVEPASPDDWEMVECNSQLLEEQFLTQAAVVSVGQRFPFWVTPQAPLFLTVTACQPAPTVRLAPGVEVAVAPRPRPTAASEGPSGTTAVPTASGRNTGDTHGGGGGGGGQQQGGGGGSAGGGVSVWLRVLPVEHVLLADMSGGGDGDGGGSDGGGDGGGDMGGGTAAADILNLMQQHTQWCWVHPTTCTAAGWRQGGVVAVRSMTRRSTPCMLHVCLHTTIPPGHILIHPLVATLHGYQPRTPIQARHHATQRPPHTPTHTSISPTSITGLRCRLLVAHEYKRPPLTGSKGPSCWDEATVRGWLHAWLVDTCHALATAQGQAQAGVHCRVSGVSGVQGPPTRKGPTEGLPGIVSSVTHGHTQPTASNASTASSGGSSSQTQDTQEQSVTIAIPPYTLIHVGAQGGRTNASGMGVSKEWPGREQGPLLLVQPMGAQGLLGHPTCVRVERDAGGGWDAAVSVLLGSWHITLSPPRSIDATQAQALMLTNNSNSTSTGGTGGGVHGGVHGVTHGGVHGGAGGVMHSGWLMEERERICKRVLLVLGWDARQRLAALGVPPPGGVLVVGPPSSGKSAIWAPVMQRLERSRQCVAYWEMVACRSMTVEAGQPGPRALLGAAVQRCITHMPSLLILDDLDVVCPAAAGDGSEAPPGSTAARGCAAWLGAVMDEITVMRLPVCICATASDTSKLTPTLKAAGRLDHIEQLSEPTARERVGLLMSVLQGVDVDAAAVEEVAVATDGCTIADLQALAQRAQHAAASRLLTTPTASLNPPPQPIGQHSGQHSGQHMALTLTAADWAVARDGFVPSSFWGVRQGGGGGGGATGWEDVGGMEDVRRVLQESLELPTRYAHLTNNAPIRLRTGVLLYGPPGCGKTHIVNAAVAAVGMRVVSIKGPEVLNKYIGASEAAVRDLFRKAQAAAPCCLFFDEFDSIAPQRGHDNTGVSDRVVNQLLTELDGVEGLQGVSVIAATSRPDLIDAALLRPGRLDRLVYCGFPDTQERLDVLCALSRAMPLASDVQFEDIARSTEGYSGADLGALLSDAQLHAVHDALEHMSVHDTGSTTPRAPPKVEVTMKHLHHALAHSAPSTSQAERTRLDSIFQRFRVAREPAVSARDAKGKGKRATLA